jgi:RiboL-PSP-HEPN
MTPIKAYEEVWLRCDQLSQLHAYLSKQFTSVFSLDDLLRSEWAMRVSALDLFVHELAAQNMLAIFQGTRPATPAFSRFQIPFETMIRIRSASSTDEATAAFDLEVRTQFNRKTFQYPEDIASALRHCSVIELWNEIAVSLGATQSEKSNRAKSIKRDLSLIVERRNKIVHEGDLQPQIPRVAWPINTSDVAFVTSYIDQIVRTINNLL